VCFVRKSEQKVFGFLKFFRKNFFFFINRFVPVPSFFVAQKHNHIIFIIIVFLRIEHTKK